MRLTDEEWNALNHALECRGYLYSDSCDYEQLRKNWGKIVVTQQEAEMYHEYMLFLSLQRQVKANKIGVDGKPKPLRFTEAKKAYLDTMLEERIATIEEDPIGIDAELLQPLQNIHKQL